MTAVLAFGNHAKVARVRVPEEATAATADTWSLLEAEEAITVTKAVWVPDAAVTGAATNNFALGVVNEGLVGTGTTAVTTVKTYASGTDSTAQVPEDLTLSTTAANLDVAEGEVLSLARTVNGTGLASPSGLVEIHYVNNSIDD
ncbi:MAG: hypothetical protein ACRDUY_08780 [Nitriliruptorales bacterium]